MTVLGSREAGEVPDHATQAPYAELRETHSAVVFLVGERAYKLKKPVDLGFLDFSTQARRRAACEHELALNRRLAEDVYLGISEVTDTDGKVCEHLLTMRRMPDDARLAHLVRSGADVDAALRDLARTIARFHVRAERSALISEYGSREALRRRWTDNFAGIAPYVDANLDPVQFREVQALVHRYLDGREALLAQRAASGAVLDGHGDLLAEDIFCLPDGIRILDCIEFDDELRYLDEIDDVACLAMDLEHLGSPRGASRFLDAYQEESGDRAPSSLVHHYIAYRAFMRAKVACLPGAAEHGARQPAALLDLAHRHLTDGRVRLILVGGNPGTGKTTTAEALGRSLDCTVLSSDRVRKELAGVDPTTSMSDEFGAGIYSEAWTARTYRELTERAERMLALGQSVVVDATWAEPEHRDDMRAMADRAVADLDCLRCVVPDEVADRRITTRRSTSDADESVAARIRQQFSEWPEAIRVECTEPVEAVVAGVVAASGRDVRACGRRSPGGHRTEARRPQDRGSAKASVFPWYEPPKKPEHVDRTSRPGTVWLNRTPESRASSFFG